MPRLLHTATVHEADHLAQTQNSSVYSVF